MFKHLPIGRYSHKQSFVHRLDPRIKIVGLCIYVPWTLSTNSIRILIAQAVVLLVLFGMARLSYYFVWQMFKGVFPLVAFVGLVSLVSYPQGSLAIVLPARICLLIFSTSLLTLTTSSMDLAHGFASILRPLRYLGFPSEQFSFMLMISIRFIPIFLEELDIIVKAQTARGLEFTHGSIVNRMKSLVSMLVLSIIFTLRRADQLALALDSRCYRGGKKSFRK